MVKLLPMMLHRVIWTNSAEHNTNVLPSTMSRQMCFKVVLQFASLFFLHLLLLINNHSALESKSALSFLSVGHDHLRALGSFGWDLAETLIKETAQPCDDAVMKFQSTKYFLNSAE